MTITSSGLICDVCGEYILLDEAQPFSVKGINGMLHCHVGRIGDRVCLQELEDALEAGDWEKLPDGPLRKAFEEANDA